MIELVDESWSDLGYVKYNSRYEIRLGWAGVDACMTKIRPNGTVSLGD